jgi:hypothetical protein
MGFGLLALKERPLGPKNPIEKLGPTKQLIKQDLRKQQKLMGLGAILILDWNSKHPQPKRVFFFTKIAGNRKFAAQSGRKTHK